MSRFTQIDERLKELQSRRKLLEEKETIRNTSMKKVGVAHEKNHNELIIDLENRAEMARNRNQGLLREIGVSLKSSKEFTVSSHRLRTPGSHTLKVAKETLGKNIDVMLPNWRDKLASKRADTIRKLEKEKAKVILRRQNMKVSMEREDNERRLVEGKRRELMEQLTLEQQEILSAESKGILMREEAEMVDGVMMRQVEDAGQMLQNLIEEQKMKTADILNGNTNINTLTNANTNANTNINTRYAMNMISSDDAITGTGTTGSHSTSVVKFDSESTSIPTSTSATTTTTTASTITGAGRLDTGLGSETKEVMPTEQHQQHDTVPSSPGPPVSRRMSSPGHADGFEFEVSAVPSIASNTNKVTTASTNILTKVESSFSPSPSSSSSPGNKTKPPSPKGDPSVAYGALGLSRSKASASMAATSNNDNNSKAEENESGSNPVNVVTNNATTTTSIAIKEQTTSPSSSTSLRTITVQHASSRRVDFTGINTIELDTCVPYLKPLFKYLTGLEGDVNLGHIYNSAEDEAAPDLSVLSNLRNADSIEVEGLLGHTAAANLVLYIMKEIGAKLLPLDLLEGIVSTRRVDTEHRKMGKKYTEVWSLICDHIKILARGSKELRPVPPEFLAQVFATALMKSFDEEDSNRVKRKVTGLLLQVMIQSSSNTQSDSTTATAATITTNTNTNVNEGGVVSNTALTTSSINENNEVLTSTTGPSTGPFASSTSIASTLPTASRGVGGNEESVVLFPNQQDGGNDQPSVIGRPLNDTSKRNLSMTAGTINISELDDDDDFEEDEIQALPEMTDLAPSDDDSM